MRLMPQLDKVTYASQFFWLSFFFLGFYAFLLKIFLPQISQILKVRMRKLGGSQTGLSTIQDENSTYSSSEDYYHEGIGYKLINKSDKT